MNKYSVPILLLPLLIGIAVPCLADTYTFTTMNGMDVTIEELPFMPEEDGMPVCSTANKICDDDAEIVVDYYIHETYINKITVVHNNVEYKLPVDKYMQGLWLSACKNQEHCDPFFFYGLCVEKNHCLFRSNMNSNEGFRQVEWLALGDNVVNTVNTHLSTVNSTIRFLPYGDVGTIEAIIRSAIPEQDYIDGNDSN